MPDYLVHDLGYNVKAGITKTDFDGLKGQVNALSNKVQSISGGGYGSNYIYNNDNDNGTSFDIIQGASGIAFSGIIGAIVDDSYRSIKLRGTTIVADGYTKELAKDIQFWGLNLSVLHKSQHLNMPIFEHVADNAGNVGWDTPARTTPWKLSVPAMPTIAEASTSVQDHRWIGHINYLKPGIGAAPNIDMGALYYHRDLNGYAGTFHTKTDGNGNVWLVPGAVRYLDSEERTYYPIGNLDQLLPVGVNAVPYTPGNIGYYIGGDENISGVTLDWEVTLNILHPGGD